MVVAKWSACSPSTPKIQIWFPLTSTIFIVKKLIENNENTQKEAGNDGIKTENGRFNKKKWLGRR